MKKLHSPDDLLQLWANEVATDKLVDYINERLTDSFMYGQREYKVHVRYSFMGECFPQFDDRDSCENNFPKKLNSLAIAYEAIGWRKVELSIRTNFQNDYLLIFYC